MDYLYKSIINNAYVILYAVLILSVGIVPSISSICQKKKVWMATIILIIYLAFSCLFLYYVGVPTALRTYDYATKQFLTKDCIIEDKTNDSRTLWLIIDSKRYPIPERLLDKSGANIGDHVCIVCGKTSRFIIDIKVLEDINP